MTILGTRFGVNRGNCMVTIGGQQADNYPVWTENKITFQLGNSAVMGNIVVTLRGLGASNGLPFTVRTGNIYFVSPTGSHSANGSYTAPWKTILHAGNAINAGDIVYVMNDSG